jgi:hypothetical protein
MTSIDALKQGMPLELVARIETEEREQMLNNLVSPESGYLEYLDDLREKESREDFKRFRTEGA